MTSVDFHFDIMCPYAYQTSRWIRAVRDAGEVEVSWKFFSLEEVNHVDGKKHPWEREWSYGWSMMRIGAFLGRRDPALVDQWYAAAGQALHVDGHKPHRPEVAEQLLVTLGLNPAWVREAIEDPTTHDEVHADHQRVLDLGGWGVPTLIFDDNNALFGPVLIDPPLGTDAVRLWHAVTAWLEFPHLYELQRPKRASDLESIAATFRPYFEARDWESVQKETP